MTKQKRVLLVEDEEIILADLSRTLEKQGYEIAGTALSGPEAVLVAASVQPDVVLMDVQLQGRMDGLEAARQIRQTSQVPIVFVTANSNTLQLANLPVHCNRISKPFSPRQLREALELAFSP